MVTINHWIGQGHVTRRFRVALGAAWNDATRLPHMLFTGPPGLGKTELAHLAAREMGVEIHERLAQVVNNLGAMNGLLLQAKEKEVVFLDEIHELPANVQTLLYRAMEGQQISVTRRDNQSTFTMPIQNVTIIGATTDEYALLRPLRDRFKLILAFEEYDNESLAQITKQRAKLLEIELSDGIADEIAKRSRGTPRLAIRILESCQRYARSIGESRITADQFERVLSLDGLDSLGLATNEQRYLQVLARKHGEPMRLMTLESALGIHRRTIQTVIEPFLIKLGFIERQPTGRVITEAGLRHVGQSTSGQIVHHGKEDIE